MREPAKAHQDRLGDLKEKVRNSHDYNKPNCDRFHDFKNFTFNSSMSDAERGLCNKLKKPTIESNIGEAYISRQRGEFSKQQPSIKVSARDDAPADPQLINIVEGHTRSILFEANNNSFEYEIYNDILGGGFSVMEVCTDYANERALNQIILLKRAFDPTLCGFDPLAQYSHKGDGEYCFKLYPKRAKEAKLEFPGIDLDSIQFVKDSSGFNWSYATEREDVLLISDLYEKKKKKAEIVHLSDGQQLTKEEYEEFLEKFKKSGVMKQAPQIIGGRDTELTTICRYRFIENKVLEYVETDFKFLPLIFVDGNSQLLRDTSEGAVRQMTRPYLYQTKGIQKLRNFALQTAANELENMTMQKWIAPKEGIPKGYEDTYTNIQEASVVVHNAYDADGRQLPPPREVTRTGTPPEVMGLLGMTDQMFQAMLGSYDAQLGINDNQLSGVAIVEAATQSNAAAMPYVVGFMQALNQAAQIIVDLLPKLYVTARTIPVTGLDGKKNYVKINQNGQRDFNYSASSLDVKVEAGVNFAIQKSRALQQIIALSQASQIFAQFINTEGLEVLLDNIEIRGVDQLKNMAKQFSDNLKKQQQQQMQQQQMQQQMQMQESQSKNNPEMMKLQQNQQELALRAQKQQHDASLETAKVGISQQDSDNERLRIMMEMKQSNSENLISLEKQQTEKARMATDFALEQAKHEHAVNRDMLDLHHKIITTHLKDKQTQQEQ